MALTRFARGLPLACLAAVALALSPESFATGKFPRPILGYGLNPYYCATPVPSSMLIPNFLYSTDVSLCEAVAAYGTSQGWYAPNPTIFREIVPPPWYQCVVGPPPPNAGALGCLFATDAACPVGSSPDNTDCDTPIDWSRNAGSCPSPSSGASGSAPMTRHPINIGTGNKYLQEEDFVTGSLRFNRYYNSQVLRNGKVLSFSWSHAWSRWIYPSPTSSTQATLYRSDGRTVGATLVNATVTNGQQAWTLDAYSGHQLIRLTDPTGATTLGWTVISDDGNVEAYDSNGVLLSIGTSQGRAQRLIYSDGFSSAGYALDANGNPTSTVLPPGLLIRITEDFGRSISFGHDAFGHLVKATDGLGQTYQYGYDSNANLASVRFPDGKIKQYLNNEAANVAMSMPQAVTGIIDENGTRYATYTYDSQGRATSSTHFKDAQATIAVDQTQVSFFTDVNGNPLSSVVIDPRDTQRTYGLTSVLSLVKGTGVNQPGGAGCGPAGSSQTFDANGNLASQVDFDGNESCYVSDPVRNLEGTRLEGLTGGVSCPASLSSYTPVSGTPQRLIRTQWHPSWRVKTAEAAPLRVTNWIYNGQPDPTNGNTPASCAPITIALADPGALLHFDGASGSTTLADVNGHTVIATGSAALEASQARFGSAALAPGTGFASISNSAGDLDVGTGDFTVEAWGYLTSILSTDSTLFAHVPATTVSPGAFQVKIQGGTGNAGFSFGNSTSGWVFDTYSSSSVSTGTWHHFALVRHGSTFTLYLDGTSILTTTSSTPILALSDPMNVGGYSAVLPISFNGYIDEFRFSNGTAVYTANFTPPSGPENVIVTQVPNLLANGVPPAVLCKKVEQATTDATGTAGFGATAAGSPRAWTYTYNAYGQTLTATGPRGNLVTSDPNYAASTTTYQYYAATDTANTPPLYQMGDLSQVTDAVGHVTQYLQYDGNGRVLEQVDPNGTTTSFTYFPRGWLQSRTVTPAGSGTSQTTSYMYDGVGQIKTVTQPDGSQINYTYDAAHRLTQITDSAGDSINYTLDAIGNRTTEQVKDPAGNLTRQVSRVYDALNRLQTVTGALQ
jgi:YD repeat-containing protein